MNNDITNAIIRLRTSVPGYDKYDKSHDIILLGCYCRDRKHRNIIMSNDFIRETYAKYIIHEKHYRNSEIVEHILKNDLSALKGLKSLNKDIILSIFSSHYYPHAMNSYEEINKYLECIDNIIHFNFK